MTGTIRSIKDKGFGFIRKDDWVRGENDYFFHASDFKKGVFETLREGQIVRFDGETSSDGKMKATNIVI
jgi:cold shock CspA family protein